MVDLLPLRATIHLSPVRLMKALCPPSKGLLFVSTISVQSGICLAPNWTAGKNVADAAHLYEAWSRRNISETRSPQIPEHSSRCHLMSYSCGT